MWSNLEAFAHLAAGMGAVVQGALLARRDEPELQRRYAVVLAVLGAALAARGLSWVADPDGLLVRAYTLGFAVLPLVAALLVESLVRRPLPLAVKVALLAGTAAFVLAAFTPWAVTGTAIGVAQTVWMMVTVGGLGAVVLAAWARTKAGPSRSLLAAFVLVGLGAPPFVFLDSAASFGLHLPRLGSVPVVLLCYFVGSILLSTGASRLRAAVQWLVVAATAVAVAVAAWSRVGGIALDEALALYLVLLLIALTVHPPTLWLQREQGRQLDVLFARLSGLPADGLASFVEALARWPELRRVAAIPLDPYTPAERERLRAWHAANGPVAERSEVARQRVVEDDPERLLAVEHLQLLLDGHDVDCVACVDDGHALGARFDDGIEAGVATQLWAVVAAMGRLVARPG